jgi:hypothetical protein
MDDIYKNIIISCLLAQFQATKGSLEIWVMVFFAKKTPFSTYFFTQNTYKILYAL